MDLYKNSYIFIVKVLKFVEVVYYTKFLNQQTSRITKNSAQYTNTATEKYKNEILTARQLPQILKSDTFY